jgi:hypothetical protein
MTYDEWLESPYYQSSPYRERVQAIVDKTGCTWEEAEAIYLDAQADAADAAYDRQREENI